MGKYLYLIKESQKRDRASIAKLREDLLEDIKDALSELSKIVSFKDAYIFGSIVNSKTFSGNSDVDIAFYDLKEKDFFKAMAFLSICLPCS
jgi:predicted nucleotidyltransferase